MFQNTGMITLTPWALEYKAQSGCYALASVFEGQLKQLYQPYVFGHVSTRFNRFGSMLWIPGCASTPDVQSTSFHQFSLQLEAMSQVPNCDVISMASV